MIIIQHMFSNAVWLLRENALSSWASVVSLPEDGGKNGGWVKRVRNGIEYESYIQRWGRNIIILRAVKHECVCFPRRGSLKRVVFVLGWVFTGVGLHTWSRWRCFSVCEISCVQYWYKHWQKPVINTHIVSYKYSGLLRVPWFSRFDFLDRLSKGQGLEQ